jgi:hypothetical protein
MRKAHGQHNLDLTNILIQNSSYNDWVITTAFYSCVHFVEHALFPLIEHGIEYPDFNDFWNRTSRHTSKHSCKKALVWKYLRTVGAKYRDLFDECNNSRYNDYNVSLSDAKSALNKANAIKAACLVKKP